MRRSAYGLDEINTASFATAAAYFDGAISVDDPIAGEVSIPRFECNFALKSQRSAGEIIRSLRNASRIYLVLNSGGLLEARIENTFALQQPTLPANSNSTEMFNGGWPAYEFDETSIARNSDGSANFSISTKGAQDTPNQLTVEFQDEFNQYQQDSFSLTDGNDSDLCGQIIAASWDAMGISNFSQASRMLLLGLNRGIEGNLFIQFETSVKALQDFDAGRSDYRYLSERESSAGAFPDSENYSRRFVPNGDYFRLSCITTFGIPIQRPELFPGAVGRGKGSGLPAPDWRNGTGRKRKPATGNYRKPRSPIATGRRILNSLSHLRNHPEPDRDAVSAAREPGRDR